MMKIMAKSHGDLVSEQEQQRRISPSWASSDGVQSVPFAREDVEITEIVASLYNVCGSVSFWVGM